MFMVTVSSVYKLFGVEEEGIGHLVWQRFMLRQRQVYISDGWKCNTRKLLNSSTIHLINHEEVIVSC
jgi:hypothetical protein